MNLNIHISQLQDFNTKQLKGHKSEVELLQKQQIQSKIENDHGSKKNSIEINTLKEKVIDLEK